MRIALAALLLFPAVSQAETLSGQYEALALAVVGDRVSGVFSAERQGIGTEDAPQFSCLFLLHGRLVGGTAAIETGFPGDPERIAGTLTVGGGKASFQLADTPGGCVMAIGDLAAEPFEQEKTEPGEGWIGAGLVTAERARLFPSPQVVAARTPYLVRFDAVAVLEQEAGWVRVRFLSGDRPATGWLKLSDVALDLATPQPGTR